MTYTPTTWVEEVTPTSAANLNNIEQGIAALYGRRLVFDLVGATTLTIPNLNGDVEGPYRIIIDGRLNTTSDAQLRLQIPGTNAGAAENRGNGRNLHIETYQNADGTVTGPSQNAGYLADNHLFLGMSRWGEANDITTDVVLSCLSSRIPRHNLRTTNKPVQTVDQRHMEAVGGGFLYYPRLVTSMVIDIAAGTAPNFSGRIVVEKLGLA